MLSAHEELDRVHARSSAALADALASIELSRVRGNEPAAQRKTEALGKQLGALFASADLLGRRRLLLELKSLGGPGVRAGLRAGADSPPVTFATPRVPALEAAEEILSRNPVLAEGWRAARDAWNARGFAVARSASLVVTEKVQDQVLRFLRGGTGLEDTIQAIRRSLQADDSSITRAYAEVVFRTNTSSAYQAGRQAMAARPAVQRVASGWRYQATLDSNVRDNHRAGESFIAHTQDPVWANLAPPNGYQCRCALELVPTSLMRRLGLSNADGSLRRLREAPPGFAPDPGYRS